jgi:hypothetical protein
MTRTPSPSESSREDKNGRPSKSACSAGMECCILPAGRMKLMPIACQFVASAAKNSLLIAVAIAAVGCASSKQRTPSAMSKYVSADGITIPEDIQRTSPGIIFTTSPGRESGIMLQGPGILATLSYTGQMETAGDGKLGGGTEKFKPTRIETIKDSEHDKDQLFAVSSFSIDDNGFLIVKDDSGSSYRIKLGLNLNGAIEDLGKGSR